jgi:hypothetical protein
MIICIIKVMVKIALYVGFHIIFIKDGSINHFVP